MEGVEIICRFGKEILNYLDAAAELRIKVFRDFPYLYDGTQSYEAEYLCEYAESDESIFVLAMAHSCVVGIATGLPLRDAAAEFQLPFQQAGMDRCAFFYHGESCLLPKYRGKGIGHQFFDFREQYAINLGYQAATFCSVERPTDHLLRPQEYRDNAAFWRKRHYRPTDFFCELAWKQIDHACATKQQLRFWINDQIKPDSDV